MKTQTNDNQGPMNEDSLYIERFLGGEEKGFDMLVRKYQDKVVTIVYSLIGKDRESEDIAQEVFLKVYHNVQSFKRRSRFSTWLYRITVNTTYDFLRRRKNFVSDEAAFEQAVASDESSHEALVRRENQALVQEALLALPVQFRAAVVLKDIEGLSYGEIAEVLSCGIGTVESRIYRGRQLLKEKLLKGGGPAL